MKYNFFYYIKPIKYENEIGILSIEWRIVNIDTDEIVEENFVSLLPDYYSKNVEYKESYLKKIENIDRKKYKKIGSWLLQFPWIFEKEQYDYMWNHCPISILDNCLKKAISPEDALKNFLQKVAEYNPETIKCLTNDMDILSSSLKKYLYTFITIIDKYKLMNKIEYID